MTRECKKSCNICAKPTVKKDLKLRLPVKFYFFCFREYQVNLVSTKIGKLAVANGGLLKTSVPMKNIKNI